MKQYRLENGKLVKVRPEHEQQFLEKHPNATLVSGNQQSSAQDATAEQGTAASNQETGQSQNNTDSNLGSGSLESLGKNLERSYKIVSSSEKTLKNLKSSMADAKAFNNEALYNSLAEEYNNVLGTYQTKADNHNNVLKQYKAEESRLVAENKKAPTPEQNSPDGGYWGNIARKAIGILPPSPVKFLAKTVIGASHREDGEETQEKNTWLEDKLGKWWLTDFIGDYERAARSGITQGESLAPSYKFWEEGGEMSDEDFAELVKRGRAMEESGQTDEMLAFNNEYAGLEEKYGSVGAFFAGWWNNPSVMTQYSVQSLANMAYSAILTEKGRTHALEMGNIAGGAALVAGQLGPQVGLPEELVTVPTAWMAGAMAGVSSTMETGFTTAELVQGMAEERGMDWQQMSDEERISWYKKVANDDELWADITDRALRRGRTIGAIDGVTALVVPGVAKGVGKSMALSRASKLTGAGKVLSGAAAETVGGLTSEYFGQRAAGQEVNVQEILIEGFADKTFTTIEAGKSIVSKPPKYTLNGQELNGKEFDRALRLMDDETYMGTNIKVENSPTVEKLINDRKTNITLDQQVDSKVSDVKDRAELIKLERKRLQLKKSKNETKSGQRTLQEVEAKIDEIMTKYEGAKADVTIENRKKAIALAVENKIEAAYNKNLKFAKQEASKLGKTIKVIKDTVLGEDSNTSIEMEKLINEHNKANPENKIDLNEALSSDGFFIGDQLVINENVAKQSGQINVGAHELLHGVIVKQVSALMKSGNMGGFINSFKNSLTSEQRNYVEKEIKRRISAGEDLDIRTTEEWLTILSDGLTKGDLTFNEGAFSKIMNWLHKVFGDNTVYNFNKKFGSGREAYNFMKDYQASIQKGKLSGKIVKTAETDIKVDTTKATKEEGKKVSYSKSDAKIPIDKLGKIDSDGNDMTEPGMGNFLYQAEADQIISTIKEEGYLDNLIAAKYKVRPVPQNFVQDVLAELTPHIKAFKPESNDSLFGWIQGQIANKAGNVYNKIYKDKGPAKTVDVDATTSEGAPLVQIEADTDLEMQRIDEIGLDDEQVQEKSKFRRALKLDDTMVDKVINTVKKAFGTKLPDINTKKFKQALTKAFKTDLKKPMQDLMGKGKDYDVFLNKFMPAIYRNLPVEVLVQMERNLDPDLRIFTSSKRITKPTEVDKLISQGKLPKDTSRTSGPLLNTKLPYPGAAKVLAFFRGTNSQELLGYKKGASTYGTRKDVLAERTITEVAFDAVATVIQDEVVASKIEDLNIAGIDKVENDLAMIGKQIDRDPTIKFSMSGAKKPSGYTSDALLRDSNILITDIKQHGYESVIEEVEDKETGEVTGKLVDGYKDLNIPQFTVNAVVNWHSTGNIDDSASVGYKTVIKGFKKVFPEFAETIDAYLTAGNLRYAKDHLNQLSKDAGIIANILGEDVMNAIGWEILGYKNRIMDPAGKKIDKAASKKAGKTIYQKNPDGSDVTGDYHNQLQFQQNDVKGKESKLPKGLNPSDVNIMNIGAPGSLFKGIMKILKQVSKKDKVKQLAKLQPRIDAANKANILMAKHVAKTIVTLAREGKISPVSALHILQSQTSIVNGFRGLSRLDLIDVRDGSQAVNENHPSYKDAVKYYKKKGLSEADAKIEALKKLGFKGEHLGPNSNTMAAIAKLIFDTNTDIDKALSKAFRGHSQLLTSKYITDVIDDKGGRTNDTDFNRVKFLDKADIDNMVSAANQSYIDVLANHEVNILIEDLFVDNSKAVELQALENKPVSVKYSKSKGMSTFDFDETLIIGGKNFVVATHPKTKDVVKIMSHDWPIKGPALASQGYSFDFSDFANVRGGKEGPLLQKMKNQIKKYGNKNVFILTARQQASAGPIHQWLKSKGISIPLRNITGLGKSEGSAKGEWMLQKFAEGYNDMYFVDDALPNVEAVKKVLDQLDIKSKVVQAKVKFSKSASQDFNKMLERSKGIAASQEFSSVEATIRGAKRGRLKFFVPPSAEDFKGLIYAFLGTGKQGDQDLVWFKDHLFNPFAKGIRKLNSLRQRMTEEYSALKKQFPSVIKSLNNKIGGTSFTVDNAIRVYLWNMAGFEVPGISESQKKLLIDHVAKNAELVAFADVLSNITRRSEGYIKPKDFWIAQNIGSDLHSIAEGANREELLAEWKENKDLVFSKENLNKIEVIYGTSFREALEDILYRMETGSNRPTGRTSTENKFINWINGSVGAVMFLNMRSAVLQGLSMVNFLNFEDNNIFAAAKAFANQKQFWTDFIYLLNSDMLKQRRAGLRIDVSASELTDAFKHGQSKVEAVIKYLLEKGFIPTKMMDSFAIAIGGSTFYRNKINTYLKQGMSQSEAESQAFLDFQEIAEETQQSSRPDLISMQQASSLGRLILAWANTPMQYTRLTKKALSDIVNGRGSLKANISKILYYGAIQNIIFGSLQTGLAFMMFGDDEDDKDRDKKETRVLNGMLDTLLRGTGVYGALASAVKNTLITAHEELGKGYGKKDYSKIMQQLISLSPPIGSKVRKIIGAIKTYDFNKDVMQQMDHGINNPAWNMFANVIEGVTNAPVGRIQSKLSNVREAIVGNHEMWQRIALVMGWSKWDIGIKDADVEEARKQVKENRKEEKKKSRAKKFKCAATKSNGKRCGMTVDNKGSKCVHHRPFKDGSDTDGDGKKEYQCKSKTGSGKRCKNRTENKSKKCYAHQ